MPAIPPFVLKKLYVKGSLHTSGDGFALDLKNVIAPGTIVAFAELELDGEAIDPTQVTLLPPDGPVRSPGEISTQAPLLFPINAIVSLHVAGATLAPGPHELVIHVVVKEVGPLDIPVSDTLA